MQSPLTGWNTGRVAHKLNPQSKLSNLDFNNRIHIIKLKLTYFKREWNFVHPNSANSKLKNLQNIETSAATDNVESKGIIAKYINADNISKILFTHMASFIVGATL